MSVILLNITLLKEDNNSALIYINLSKYENFDFNIKQKRGQSITIFEMEYLSINITGNELLAHLNDEIAECREHLRNWRNVENKLVLEIAETKNTALRLIAVLYNENRRDVLAPSLHRLAGYMELWEHKRYCFQRVSGITRSFMDRISVLLAAVEEEEDRLFDLAEVHYVGVSGNRAPSA